MRPDEFEYNGVSNSTDTHPHVLSLRWDTQEKSLRLTSVPYIFILTSARDIRSHVTIYNVFAKRFGITISPLSDFPF